MKICPDMVRKINIENGTIIPCCQLQYNNIPSSPLHTENCIRKYLDALQRCIDNYGEFCPGCPKKYAYEIPGSAIADAMDLSMVFINHHRHFCDCKCVYCDFWKTSERPSPIRPLLEELLGTGLVNKDAIFAWGGGESTLLFEFEETASMLHEKKFRQSVLTNGLHHSPAIEQLLADGLGWVMISLDSGTEETFRAIKGRGGFRTVTATLEKYAAVARNLEDITVKYILFDKNNTREEIDAFFAFCSSLGPVTVNSSFDLREMEHASVSSASKDALLYFYRNAIKNGFNYGDWLEDMYPGSTSSLLSADSFVYYWGCGEYYQLNKQKFSHCTPKYMLLDKNPDGITQIDGIPVRHPDAVLSNGEDLPIVIFAQDPKPILQTITEKYPWYTPFGRRTCYSTAVYYWGCGEYYQLHKHEFTHYAPRYILLDKNPGGITEMDGIPIRHPAEILPHGARLPIVIFAYEPNPILRAIAAEYPWYAPVNPHACVHLKRQG